jgi:hypothetical protein
MEVGRDIPVRSGLREGDAILVDWSTAAGGSDANLQVRRTASGPEWVVARAGLVDAGVVFAVVRAVA